MWGRCVNDTVRKLLQLQISTNIAAVVITAVSAIYSLETTPSDEYSHLYNYFGSTFIMDTFAALVLATDPASEKLLDR